MSQPIEAPKTSMQKFLDVVEKVGNKVPHPAVIFLILIAIVVVLSHVLHLLGRASRKSSSQRRPTSSTAVHDYRD